MCSEVKSSSNLSSETISEVGQEKIPKKAESDLIDLMETKFWEDDRQSIIPIEY